MEIIKTDRNMRVPCICTIRTANMVYNGYVIGTISEESNDACEFDWVIKVNWENWEKAGKPKIAGINEDLRLDEYVRAYVPMFVEERTMSDSRDNIRKELKKYNLRYNDRFEYMCLTHGRCATSMITVERA